MSTLRERALKLHKDHRGKIATVCKVPIATREDLSLAYTPGVAEPCRDIAQHPDLVYDYTNKGNLVAVVTDGSAVLGLGNLGAAGAYPVMEGKAALFKTFADVDAVSICLDTQDPDTIINTVKLIAPSFGGINLEDISAPRCFYIEEALQKALDIPVFHDDQHGTAIVVLGGLINALRFVGKDIGEVKIVINGIGSAGAAVADILTLAGAQNLCLVGRHGILHPGGLDNNPKQESLAQRHNPHNEQGNLAHALKSAHVFIGVSVGDIVTWEMISAMAEGAIVFAMANPVPEIMPDQAQKGGAQVIGTGRSDFPNQINNVLAFPGIFRGALDVRAREINVAMKLAAAYAIADSVEQSKLSADYIIPDVFDKRVAALVAQRVAQAARDSGVARL